MRNTTVKRFLVPRTPLNRIYLELTNRCNFACEFCPNPVMERAGGRMDLELLDRVLDEVSAADLARSVLFHQQGEPLLHPRVADAVRAASGRGLRACITTNGSTLTPGLVDDLLAAGLERLTISLQTPDEASFRIRGARNLEFAAFEARVAAAVRRILSSGARTEVSVAFLTAPFGPLALPTVGRDWSIVARTGELRAILARWAERALDGVPAAPAAAEVARTIARAHAARPNRLRLAPRLVFETRPVGEWPAPTAAAEWVDAPFGTCHGLTDHFAVLWDGRYSYCCVDYDGRTSQARFQDVSILDFLGSKPVQRAIRGFERFSPVHPYCRTCLGGSSRRIALAKALGSIAYFKLYRRLLAREGG